MQQADYQCHRPTPWMQESVSMNARKCVHECKKVCPCTKALPQSGIRAWIKQGRRKRKKRGRETGKTEARRLMERKAAQQNKNTSEELNKAYLGIDRLTKQGGGAPNFPQPQNMTPAPHHFSITFLPQVKEKNLTNFVFWQQKVVFYTYFRYHINHLISHLWFCYTFCLIKIVIFLAFIQHEYLNSWVKLDVDPRWEDDGSPMSYKRMKVRCCKLVETWMCKHY